MVQVFERLLVHTKGRWARQPFHLAPWQRYDVIEPLFGNVEWSPELARWIRVHRIGWIELARKNGKSELLAGIALVLLVADDEEGSEVYGCAHDRDQAGKVFRVAARMVELSPTLSKRLKVLNREQRIIDTRTASWYEVVPADELGNVGHNPHGIVFDEVWTQRTPDLWNAMRTAMGTRDQPLMVAATTAGRDLLSFARTEHDYCTRVENEPGLDRRRFVYVRSTPPEADWHDESTWTQANPALGQFLSIEALRDEYREACTSPMKEQAFRQFRLNQWVNEEARWIRPDLYDGCPHEQPALEGRPCYGGLDLAAVSDLTSLCWFFPPAGDDLPAYVRWHHFAPEAALARLAEITSGSALSWVQEGWLTVTDGEVCDYDVVHAAIAHDAQRYAVVSLGLDRWNSTATTTWLGANLPKLPSEQVAQTFGGLSSPMKEMMRLVRTHTFGHGGNPVARWCFLSCEVRTDVNENIRPVKPDRMRARHRIDAVASAAMAVDGWMRRPVTKPKRAVGF